MYLNRLLMAQGLRLRELAEACVMEVRLIEGEGREGLPVQAPVSEDLLDRIESRIAGLLVALTEDATARLEYLKEKIEARRNGLLK